MDDDRDCTSVLSVGYWKKKKSLLHQKHCASWPAQWIKNPLDKGKEHAEPLDFFEFHQDHLSHKY